MDIASEIRKDPENGARILQSEYKAGLTTLARRLCVDESDAEELVNRTFAEVVRSIDAYLEQSAFFGWMCQILVNIRSKDLRRKSSRVEVADAGAVDAASDEDSAARLFRDVDAGLVRDAVQTLPGDMREAVVLRYFMDLPLRRIAKILCVPEGTVNSRLHYARLALAAKLGAATRRPGARLVLLALLLAAGLAVGRGVYALASAALPSRAESAESVSHAEFAESTESVSHAENAESAESAELSPSTPSTSSTPSTLSTVPTVSTPESSEMNAKPLLAASSLALAAAPVASSATGWTYTPPAPNLTRGTLSWTDSSGFENVVQGIRIVSGTEKKLYILESTNGNNSNVRNLDFSVGIEDGYELVDIQRSAFNGNSTVTNFVAPSSLVTLGRYAFNSCSALVHVELNDGLETIGTYAFQACKALSTIDNFLPSSVKFIDQNAFQSCTALACDLVATGVTNIAARAFQYSAVTSVDLSEAPLDTIGELAFYQMPGLTNVVFNPSIRSIGREAFRGCKALKTVSPLLPTGLQFFGSGEHGVFRECTALEGDVLWPNSLTNISDRAFYQTKITTFTARGKDIVRFGVHPVLGCTALTNIVLSASIATYGSALMDSCKGGSLERHVWFLGSPPAAFPSQFFNNTDKQFVTLHLPWSQQDAWREYAATASNATFTFNKATKTLPEKINDVGTWQSGITQNVTWFKDEVLPTMILIK